LPALAGANLIYGLGMFESGCTMDYGQLVMDNEFAAMIKYMLKGIPVRPDTLALNVIKEVGQFKEFVSHEHTYDNMHAHQTYPRFIDRNVREIWEAAGSRNIHERAWEEARHILATHRPEPLPAAVQETIRNIVIETEKEMGVVQRP
jgi:trimethylamine---corrinoid protein Co-methyltransferase